MVAPQSIRLRDDERSDVEPGSVFDEAMKAFERPFRPPSMHPDMPNEALNAIVERLLDAAVDARCALLTARLRGQGFRLVDTARWTRDLSLRTTEADVDEMVEWAVAFRAAGATQAEARQWWNAFTSLHWSLGYRALGHSPQGARDIFDAVPVFGIQRWRWVSPISTLAHEWAMTGVPAGRVRAYIELGVSPKEALQDWEPRPDCAETIAVMLALTPRGD